MYFSIYWIKMNPVDQYVSVNKMYFSIYWIKMNPVDIPIHPF